MAPVQWGAVICASLAGACYDLKSRRIPNWLSAGVLCAGLGWSAYAAGFSGVADAGAGCVLLAAPYVLLFLFAGGGAGDAKLMGALGAWLGMLNGAVVLSCVAASGILLALAYAAKQRRLRSVLAAVFLTFVGLAAKLISGRAAQRLTVYNPREVNEARKIPYGPAIFVGVCLAAVGVAVWKGHI